MRGERPTIYGTGEKRRDFVYVDDVNDFHLRCLTDARTDGRVFNLGSGTSLSVREIYDKVRLMLGSTLEPLYAPDLPGDPGDGMLLVGGPDQPDSFSAKLRWVGRVGSRHCSPFRALFSV